MLPESAEHVQRERRRRVRTYVRRPQRERVQRERRRRARTYVRRPQRERVQRERRRRARTCADGSKRAPYLLLMQLAHALPSLVVIPTLKLGLLDLYLPAHVTLGMPTCFEFPDLLVLLPQLREQVKRANDWEPFEAPVLLIVQPALLHRLVGGEPLLLAIGATLGPFH